MIFHKGIAIIFVLLCMKYDFLFVSGEVRCIEREREALQRFRLGLGYYGVLSLSWGTEECCNWEGVVCSNTTGHVAALLLDDLNLQGQITPDLLELHHLNHLDLSGNYFIGSGIPDFIGSMKQLEYLNLSNSHFSGIIPPQLGNLTNLRTLDLSVNSLLRSDNLNWLTSLYQLSELNLTLANLSDTNWLEPIVKLHSLQDLRLAACSIADVVPSPGLFVNSSSSPSLSVLDLSFNKLTSSTFDWLFNISTSLVKIDLSNNALHGLIPDAFGRLASLEYLNLFQNMFEGEIPKSMGNLSHLQRLSLSDNHLGGSLDGLIGNISCKKMASLEIVALSFNRFTGPIPDLRACFAVRRLSISYNKLTGSLPISLGELAKLEVLDVSFNSLEGTVSEANFMKLHNLKVLDLSFNIALTMQIAPDWNPPFQLQSLILLNCTLGPHFPKWIQTQSNLRALDLSYAGISGEMPKWLWSFSPSLHSLLLSSNRINGTIPDLSSTSLFEIDISLNKISGPIPLFPPNNILSIQLSQNMLSGSISSICTNSYTKFGLIDLSNNQLTGALPNCWDKIKDSLQYLNLANNSFSGEIPHAFGSLRYLRTLHLRDNNLFGELPSTLKNCKFLQLIDLGGNKFTGNISWIDANYTFLNYLILGHNRFYGSVPSEICHLTRIQVLDLSRNNFTGKIPDCFNNFTLLVGNSTSNFEASFGYISYQMEISFSFATRRNFEDAFVQWKGQESEYTRTMGLLKLIDLSSNRFVGSIPRSFSSLKGLISLNLSRNSLTGNIIPGIGQMEMLECLDLSRNQLSGEIPTGLAQLHYLSVLDLANNNLSGEIPSGPQLQSFDPSAYAENNGLCGRPLTLCPKDGLIPSIADQGNHIISLTTLQESCISMALGFIVGFWGVVGSLVLKKSWRSAYFNFMDRIGDWLYVTTIIFLNKFRRK